MESLVGGLSKRKRIYSSPIMWKEVIQKLPAGRLLLVGGDDRECEEVRSAVEELGLGGNIEVLGYVPHDRVSSLLRQSKVFILPSMGEVHSLATAEAMAAGGCACVVSSLDSLREIFSDNATM